MSLGPARYDLQLEMEYTRTKRKSPPFRTWQSGGCSAFSWLRPPRVPGPRAPEVGKYVKWVYELSDNTSLPGHGGQILRVVDKILLCSTELEDRMA